MSLCVCDTSRLKKYQSESSMPVWYNELAGLIASFSEIFSKSGEFFLNSRFKK